MPSATKPIETIRVGERVLVDAPQAALDADPRYRGELDLEPIEPAKWRLVRMRAEERWPDGTVDVTHVDSLQPLEWIQSQHLQVGSMVTLSASELHTGEQLEGRAGPVTVTGVNPLPGTHRANNLTVQGEHFYRVAECGVLVHNGDCGPKLSSPNPVPRVIRNAYDEIKLG